MIRFADSSYFVAFLNPRDQWHHEATRLTDNFDGRIVTTAWVLSEVAASMSAVENRERFILLHDDLLADAQVEIVEPSWEWFQRGIDLFRRRHDKEWSLTDCISFQVMQDRGLHEALTADHHFKQAGFTVLLRSN